MGRHWNRGFDGQVTGIDWVAAGLLLDGMEIALTPRLTPELILMENAVLKVL